MKNDTKGQGERENKKGDRERQNATKHGNRTPLELWSTISDLNMTIK